MMSSLIEHKSRVGYNVVMLVLRYMVFTREDYEKEMEKRKSGVSIKGFQISADSVGCLLLRRWMRCFLG